VGARQPRANAAGDNLLTLTGEAFDVIHKIIPLSKGDQKIMVARKKSWLKELRQRASHSQEFHAHF